MDPIDIQSDLPVSNEDVNRLDAFLRSDRVPEGAMWIDELHGFITALVCGPEVVMPSEWMSMVWNGEAPEWQSVDELRDLLGGIMRLWNTVAKTVNGCDGYEPILMTVANELGEEETVVEGWCRGFLRGVDMRREAWLAVKDEAFSLDLFTILALARAGETGEAEEVVYNREMREQLIQNLPDTVYRLRAYWREHEVPVESPVPDDPAGPTEGRSSKKHAKHAKPMKPTKPKKAAKTSKTKKTEAPKSGETGKALKRGKASKASEGPKPRKSGAARAPRGARAAGSAGRSRAKKPRR
jgi:uncharacterized protein